MSTETAAAPKKSKTPFVVGGLAVALIGGVGAAYALGAFDGLTGGGKQPADVLPGNAIAYMSTDFNPTTTQKVGAFRLFDKLPEAKGIIESGNPKKALFEQIAKDNEYLSEINYDQDIAPWIGERFGVAMLPPADGSSDPIAVFAVQITDEEKATTGLDKLEAVSQKMRADSKDADVRASANTKAARIFVEDYVLLTGEQDQAAVQQQVDEGKLAAQEQFTGDMEALGDRGVASFWMNQAEVVKYADTESSTPAAVDQLNQRAGRSAGALRFDANYAELAMVSRDVQQPTINALTNITDLPTDTAGVFSFAGGKTMVNEFWPTVQSAIDASGTEGQDMLQASEEFGFKLPDDLGTLLGDQFDIIVGTQDVRAIVEGEMNELPKAVIRVKTDTAAAEGVIDAVTTNVANRLGLPFGVPRETAGDRLLIGLNTTYMDTLKTPAEQGLGTVAGFQRTVPEPDKQSQVLFLNLDAFEDQYIDQVPEDRREFVRALQAVGVTQTPVTDGQATGLLRVSVND